MASPQPLFLEDPTPLSAYEEQRLDQFRRDEDVISVSAVRINPAVFEADAVTFQMEGRTYALRGSKRNGAGTQTEGWSGRYMSSTSSSAMVLVRGPSGISGDLDVESTRYFFYPMGSRSVMVLRRLRWFKDGTDMPHR